MHPIIHDFPLSLYNRQFLLLPQLSLQKAFFTLFCFAVFFVVPVFTASGPATPETHNKARDWATAVVVHWAGMKYVYTLH